MPDRVKRTRNTPKKYQDYTQSDRAKAVALAELHSNNVVASDLTGVPKETVRYWRNSGTVSSAEVQAVNGDLSKELEILAWELAGLAREKFGTASLSHVAHALGVAVDRAQALRNPQHPPVDNTPMTREQAVDRLRMYLQDTVKQQAQDAIIDVAPTPTPTE